MSKVERLLAACDEVGQRYPNNDVRRLVSLAREVAEAVIEFGAVTGANAIRADRIVFHEANAAADRLRALCRDEEKP